MKFASTRPCAVTSTSRATEATSRSRRRSWIDFGDDVTYIEDIGRSGLLAREAGQVANDLARAPALGLDERDLLSRSHGKAIHALEQLRGAEDRLERIVDLVRDAGHEQADGGQPLLTDDLALQRQERFTHPPLLLDLTVEIVVRLPDIGRHGGERFLQFAELTDRHRARLDGGEVPAGDPLRGAPELAKTAAENVRDRQRQEEDGGNRERRDDDVATPGGRQARGGDPGRDSDTQQPVSALDPFVAEETLDAVDADRLTPIGDAQRVHGTLRDHAPDVLLGLEAAREDAARRIRQGHDRPFGQRNSTEERLEARQVDAEAEHAPGGAACVFDRVGEHDGRPSRYTAGHERAHDRLAALHDIREIGVRDRHARAGATGHAAAAHVVVAIGEQDVQEQGLILHHVPEQRVALVITHGNHDGVARKTGGRRVEAVQVLVEVRRRRDRDRVRLFLDLSLTFESGEVGGPGNGCAERDQQKRRGDDDLSANRLWREIQQPSAILPQEQRIGDACLGKSARSQDAAVAVAARTAVRQRVVAAVREAIVEPERNATPDDFCLGQRNERRVHAEAAALHARARGESRQRLERGDELRAAVGIARNSRAR